MLTTTRGRWKVSFSNGVEWTPENSGPLIGPIRIQHNSIGATVGGELLCDGYIDWPPYSVSVTITYDHVAIAYAVIGVIRTSTADDGTRTSALPLINHAALDKGGLARLGTRFGGVERWGCTLPEVTFGMTLGARLDQAVEQSAVSAWGVLPDGRFVCGHPQYGQGVTLPNDERLEIEGSGYEVADALTEYELRPAERWAARLFQRSIGPLHPRKGAGINTDEALRKREQDLLGGGAAWPLLLYGSKDVGVSSGDAYVFGAIDLARLIRESHSNPERLEAEVLTEGLHITLSVEYDNVWPDVPPADFLPVTQYTAGELTGTDDGKTNALLHRYYEFYMQYPQWRVRVPTEDQASHDEKLSAFTNWEDAEVRALALAAYEKHRLRAWQRRVAQEYVGLSWGEWLTTALPVNVEAARTAWLERSALGPESAPSAGNGGVDIPEPIYFGRQIALLPYATSTIARAWCAGNFHRPSNLKNRVKPQQDTGKLQFLAFHEASLHDGRRRLDWQFKLPEELLRAPRADLPATYYWVFALALEGVATEARATISAPNVTWYYSENTADIDRARHVPTFDMPLISPETYQGTAHGMLFCGPAQVMGQWITHSEMVIDLEHIQTHFQTSSVQRGRT